MPQPDEEIRDILGARLDTMPGRPPIAWPNEDFITPVDADGNPLPWLRATFAPIASRPLSVNGGNPQVEDTGLFLVECFVAQSGGTEVSDPIATQVRARFPLNPPLQGATVAVRILSTSRAPGLKAPAGEPAAFFVPITVRWRCVYTSG